MGDIIRSGLWFRFEVFFLKYSSTAVFKGPVRNEVQVVLTLRVVSIPKYE